MKRSFEVEVWHEIMGLYIMFYGVCEIRNAFQLHNANIIILFLLYKHFNPESSIMGITANQVRFEQPNILSFQDLRNFSIFYLLPVFYLLPCSEIPVVITALCCIVSLQMHTRMNLWKTLSYF